MSGIPLYDIPIYMKDAVTKWNGREYLLAKRGGLFEGNIATGELAEVYKLVEKYNVKGNFDIVGLSQELAKTYGKIDDFFKFTKFLEQLETNNIDLSRVGSKATQESIDVAIREAQKWGMDYSLASPSVKAARRTIAPFISYQYKIAPLLVESAIKRPWVLAKYTAVPIIMAEMAKDMMDISEEDWQKAKADLPSFIQKSNSYAPLLWKSPEGEVQWFNMEYYLPWQQYMAIGRDVKHGNYGELLGDFGITNPLADVYAVAKTMKGDKSPKDPFTGKDIFNQLDSPAEKAAKTTEWLYNQWAPSMLTRHGVIGKGVQALTGHKDKQGRIMSPERAALSLLGINIVSPVPEQAVKERDMMLKDLHTSLARIEKDPTVSMSGKEDARERFTEKIGEVFSGHEEEARSALQNVSIDTLVNKYIDSPSDDIYAQLEEVINNSPEKDRNRLLDRVEHIATIRNLPDGSWWDGLSAINSPETRAEIFWKKYSKASLAEQDRMIETVGTIKGISSDRFLDKIEELASKK